MCLIGSNQANFMESLKATQWQHSFPMIAIRFPVRPVWTDGRISQPSLAGLSAQ